MPETAKLRIVGRCVELDAGLAQTLVARGIGEIAVDADLVRVRGEFVVPGGTVAIRCRELSAEEALIDVSGRAPPLAWSAPRADAGQAGQDGAAGADGGVIRIVCERLLSVPRLLACGSPGGDSQGGGNGLQPTTPRARDGAFNKAKDGGPFGGRVLKKFGLSYFLSVAYGEHGHDGGRGGDGLPPGRPGCGGDGGGVDVSSGAPSPTPFEACADAGAPGECGSAGKGAKGGTGGLGGLNRLYRYQWFKKTFDLPMNSGNAEVAWARKSYGLAPHAASGRAGPAGSDSDVGLTAHAGAPGVVRCRSMEAADLATAFDAGFLRQVHDWAEQALDCAQVEAAQEIARWGVSLLDAGAAPADSMSLRRSLEQLLSQIRPSGHPRSSTDAVAGES